MPLIFKIVIKATNGIAMYKKLTGAPETQMNPIKRAPATRSTGGRTFRFNSAFLFNQKKRPEPIVRAIQTMKKTGKP